MLEELLKNEEMNPQVQDVFTLKHNGNLYEVGFEELVRLAQKGMDYDRIRKDRDECRQKIKMLENHSHFLSMYIDIYIFIRNINAVKCYCAASRHLQ